MNVTRRQTFGSLAIAATAPLPPPSHLRNRQRRPEAIAVAVGSFVDPTFPPPSQSVYNKRRHVWGPSFECP
jgi:hypothetical protein